MERKALHSDLKGTFFEAMYESALRVALSKIPIEREVLQSEADNQINLNLLTYFVGIL